VAGLPLAVVLLVCSHAHTDAAPTIEQGKPRPHLFYTASDIASFAARITDDPARYWYERRVVLRAETALTKGTYGGSHSEELRDYFERLDEVALAALVDPDPGLRQDYLELGIQVLTRTAAEYDAMGLDDFWTASRAPSTLALAVLYDSIYDALSPAQRHDIETGLFERILADAPGYTEFDQLDNKGVIAHMAYGVVALAIEDQQAFERAYGTVPDGDPSFLWAIGDGYGDDGIWLEPSQHYHHYTMDHLLPFARATLNATTTGVSEVLSTSPSLAEIYAAYIGVATPQLTIVPTGDAYWPMSVRSIHGEQLNSLYPGDDSVEWVLHHSFDLADTTRGATNFAWDVVYLLDYGDPGGWVPAPAVYDDDGSGFGVLRYGDDLGQLYAFMDFASPHPNHDHRDKLSVYLAGHRQVPVTSVVKTDRSGYGHTIFQNTVVIDRTSQSKEEGELGHHGVTPRHRLQLVEASAPQVYTGVEEYQRILVLFADNWVFDLFTIVRSGQHTYDWVQHRLDAPSFAGVGSFGSASAGSSSGYDRLTQVQSATIHGETMTAESASSEHGGIRTVVAARNGDTLFRAQAPGPGSIDEHPLLLVRRVGDGGAQFAAVHAMSDGAQTPAAIAMATSHEHGGWQSEVYVTRLEAPGHSDDLLVHRGAPDGGAVAAGDYDFDGKAALVRRSGTIIESVFLLHGTLLTSHADTLIHTFGVVADVESAGDTVAMSDDVVGFRIHAPVATTVLVGGTPVTFARDGHSVVSPWMVPNLPPVADAGGPYTGLPGEAITFDGSGSHDPEGQPLTYHWDFGDGATGAGAAPSHAYTDAGEYTVVLVVSDGLLESEPASVPVLINAAAGLPAAGETVAAPAVTRLHHALPNPFGVATQIGFDLAGAERISLGIYDVSGRRVRLLVDRVMGAGRYRLEWDGRSDAGAPLPSGIYIARLVTGGEQQVRKMLLAR
jgi:hypothetical protein